MVASGRARGIFNEVKTLGEQHLRDGSSESVLAQVLDRHLAQIGEGLLQGEPEFWHSLASFCVCPEWRRARKVLFSHKLCRSAWDASQLKSSSPVVVKVRQRIAKALLAELGLDREEQLDRIVQTAVIAAVTNWRRADSDQRTRIEDLTGGVSSTFWTKHLKGEIDGKGPWRELLRKIAIGKVLNLNKSERKRPGPTSLELIEEPEGPAQVPTSVEMGSLMAGLSGVERTMLHLKVVVGLPWITVAQSLELSVEEATAKPGRRGAPRGRVVEGVSAAWPRPARAPSRP